jgi:hypothetical protein
MITLSEALKAFRRGVHVYEGAWRCAVIADPRTAHHVFDEIAGIMEGGSLKLSMVNRATRTIHGEKGGILRVFAIDDSMDAYAVAGLTFTQIIWLHTPRKEPEYVRAVVQSRLRSDLVPINDLKEQEASL